MEDWLSIHVTPDRLRISPWGTFVLANCMSEDQIPVTGGKAGCIEVAFQESRLWGSPGQLPRVHGCSSGLALRAAYHLLGITVPFVLILVDISFHTLLNEPLQKG